MLNVRPRPPADYSLCNQTVTIYHQNAPGSYTRTVIERGAFLEYKKAMSVDKTGSRESNSFLLVVPCSEPCVFMGDKVLPGEGPEIPTREAWAALVPAKVPGLAVVQYVDPKHWQGKLVHVEAGG